MKLFDSRISAFSARVAELRRKNELTQAELAKRAGVTVETVARIERAVRGRDSANPNPTLETVFRLADAFGVDAGALLDGAASNPKLVTARQIRLAIAQRLEHEAALIRRGD